MSVSHFIATNAFDLDTFVKTPYLNKVVEKQVLKVLVTPNKTSTIDQVTLEVRVEKVKSDDKIRMHPNNQDGKKEKSPCSFSSVEKLLYFVKVTTINRGEILRTERLKMLLNDLFQLKHYTDNYGI